jgi:tungstate transport system ATP-binding protein
VGRGEFVAVVGANGAGKTTLLRALHGLAPLSAGERVVPREGARIAMLFQRPFLVRASVLFNLELALWLAGVPRRLRRERALQALAHVGLEAAARRLAQELSFGQQQRVAFARALLAQPDLLLLDEPTVSLDPDAALEVEALLAATAARGVSVVMTSHNPEQVRRLARRLVQMQHGRVGSDVDGPVPVHEAASPGAAGRLRTQAVWA